MSNPQQAPANPKFTDDDLIEILKGGTARGRRVWLVNAYALGQVTKDQVERFGGEG